MRVLLDHNVPAELRRLLSPHDVSTTRQMGWAELVNGRLLAAAEAAGFECLLTGAQNLPYQNNLTGRRIAVVVVNSIKPDVLTAQISLVVEALSRATAGVVSGVKLDIPPLRRRRFPDDFMP